MKKYILLAGVGFYFLTFMAIVGIAWLDVTSDPEFHNVTNVITGERVQVLQYHELTKFRELEFAQNFAHPMAAADVPADAKALNDKLDAWAGYLGSLNNVRWEDGKVVNPPKVEDGEHLYKITACWHCHSQFVRPFDYENRRWGPTAQIGEASYESPHYFATRRVGPDLLREGGARPDDWHYAHFYNPRFTVPQSIMAPFGGVTRYFTRLSNDERDAIEKEVLDNWAADPKHMPSDEGQAGKAIFDFLVESADQYKDNSWVLYKGRSEATSADVTPGSFPVIRATPRPTQEMIGLVAYIQTRGINIGTTGELLQKFRAWENDKSDEGRDKFLFYLRKKGFQAGNWRQQPATAKPTGEPDYVFAPAIMKVLDKVVRGQNLTREEQDYAMDVDIARFRLKTWRQSVRRGADLFGKKCTGCHGGLEDNTYANERFTDSLTLSTDYEYLEATDPGKFALVGNGYGPGARWLVPEPRNFKLDAPKDANGRIRQNISYATIYKYRSSERNELPLPRDLFHQIRNGMMPSAMPAWPFLTDWEVWDLVNFIMFLGENKTARAQTASDLKGAVADDQIASQVEIAVKDFYSLPAVRKSFATRIVIPAIPEKDEKGVAINRVYLEKRGEELFKRKRQLVSPAGAPMGTSQCADCHGIEGDGWGTKRPDTLNKHGFPARNFWVGQFKLGISEEDLYLTLFNGIAGTAMNKQNTGWSDIDAWALVFYVRKMALMGVTKIEEK